MWQRRDDHKISQQGFTIVETIVTLVITTLFIVIFVQTVIVVEAQRAAVLQQTKANDIAISNLHKITTRTVLAGQVCTTAGWDLTNPTFGYAIDSETGYTATLWAYPANGCGSFSQDPIRVVSTVKYKINGVGTETTVVHASFIH